jgi:TfoX/Sxy family transcriptional regulator of competence genes
MSAWKKVPVELARRFDEVLPADSSVERRQMFGCPCAFVNGNIFAGLNEDRLILRIPDEAASRPCVIMGRTMKQYAAIDHALKLDAPALARWVERAWMYTRELPPKVKRPRKKTLKSA